MKKYALGPKFALFFSGYAVSGLGNWIDYVVINLYVYHLFGSASILGTFLAARLLPTLLFAPLGGYLADRFDRRRLLISCDLARAVLILLFLVVDTFPEFIVLALLLSSLDKINQAAQGAYVPDLVTYEQLLSANGWLRSAGSVAMILGPALGGVLVAQTGFIASFIIDSATFVVSALSLVLIGKSAAQQVAAKKADSCEKSTAGQMKAFLLGSRIMLCLFVVRFMDSLGSGSFLTALPVFGSQLDKGLAQNVGSSYGWLIGIWAVGALIGTMGAMRLWGKDKIPVLAGFTISTVIMAASIAMVFHMTTVLQCCLACLACGVGDGISGLVFQTSLMRQAPENIRGQVIGSSLAVMHTGTVVGMTVSAPFMDAYPVYFTTDVASGVIIVSAVAAYLVVGLRRSPEAGQSRLDAEVS